MTFIQSCYKTSTLLRVFCLLNVLLASRVLRACCTLHCKLLDVTSTATSCKLLHWVEKGAFQAVVTFLPLLWAKSIRWLLTTSILSDKKPREPKGLLGTCMLILSSLHKERSYVSKLQVSIASYIFGKPVVKQKNEAISSPQVRVLFKD